jgi:18S rRNA (adenine1779-N6/adenine1780-N6)-dimethyltransferase
MSQSQSLSRQVRIPMRRWSSRTTNVDNTSVIEMSKSLSRSSPFPSGKSKGQYMIQDDHLVEKVIDSLRIRSTDTVLELGGGNGSITSRLLPISKDVISIENDARFMNENMKRCRDLGFSSVRHIQCDALKMEYPRFDVCVSNLPFSLSAPLLIKLVKHRPLWRSCVLIVQREFADALIADPGERNYSRLSMNMSLFFRTERVARINGASFYPVTPVEAALIRLDPRNPPPAFDFDEWNAVVKACFIEKKTNLRRAFTRPSMVKLLEVNYKSFCSFHQHPTSPLPFSQYLQAAITDSGLSHYCAKQLPPDAIEHLLETLHLRGIYFTTLPSRVDKQLVGMTTPTIPETVVPEIPTLVDQFAIPVVS